MDRREFIVYGARTAVGLALLTAGCGAQGSAAGSSRILVYGALTAANGEALKKGFEAAHPEIGVDVVTAGTGALLSRVEAERRSGGVRADVLVFADPTAISGLDAEGLLADYLPKAAEGLPADLRAKRWFAPFAFHNLLLAHKGLASPPSDWPDLTAAAYRSQVELGDPAYSGTTLAMVGVLADRLGWSFFETLSRDGARVVKSTNTVGVDVAGGSRQVGISLDAVATPLVRQGSPIEPIWPKSGAIAVPAPVALTSNHDTPAARQFADWLLTPTAQGILGGLGLAPVLGGRQAAHTELPVDWARLQSERQGMLERFKSIFGA